MSDTLKQLRESLVAKRARLGDLFAHKSTGDDGASAYDFQAVKADWLPDDVAKLKGTQKTARVCELVQSMTAEVEELQDQVSVIEEAVTSAKAFEDRAKLDKEPVRRPAHPEGRKDEGRTLGERVIAHELYNKWAAGSVDGKMVFEETGAKTLFQTSAGWEPEVTRTGVEVDAVTRPLQIVDILPSGNTGQAAVSYMLETTRTHAAAETNEGAAYPASEFVQTPQSVTVRKIADSIAVTDEQLEDVAMVSSYLDGRLNFGVMQRLDQQVVSGDGVAPNIDGILNTSGIQTQANGGDPVPDTIFKCMTKIRVTGRSIPTHVGLHPNDWQGIKLLRTADGIYIWGNPSEAGSDRIWGLPVFQNESLTENTGLVGSFMPAWITLFNRRGITVDRGYVGNQFTEGEISIRASGRWALVVYRPAAFCTATGI